MRFNMYDKINNKIIAVKYNKYALLFNNKDYNKIIDNIYNDYYIYNQYNYEKDYYNPEKIHDIIINDVYKIIQ